MAKILEKNPKIKKIIQTIKKNRAVFKIKIGGIADKQNNEFSK